MSTLLTGLAVASLSFTLRCSGAVTPAPFRCAADGELMTREIQRYSTVVFSCLETECKHEGIVRKLQHMRCVWSLILEGRSGLELL